MIKESSNPTQGKTNFLKIAKGLCCGDETLNDCKHVFAIPTGETLASVEIKNLFDNEWVTVSNPTSLNIENQLEAAGYIIDGVSVIVTPTEVTLFGQVENVRIVLSNAAVVTGTAFCNKTIICDFVAPYTGGATTIELNGTTYNLSPGKVYGTDTAASVKADIDALITPVTCTVSDNNTLGLWEVTIKGVSLTEFKIGGTEADKCKCKKEYI